MNRRVYGVVSCGCLVLALLTSACNQQPATPADTRATDEKTVRDLDSQWSKDAGTNDVDKIVSYYSDDAVLLFPNEPTISGKQGVRASWASLVGAGANITWQASKVEVSRSGDLAYSWGNYQLSMKDPQGKPVSDKGKFLEIWKKQADGNWKVIVDTYNSDLPAMPPAPEGKKK